jgi:hypothetical protein
MAYARPMRRAAAALVIAGIVTTAVFGAEPAEPFRLDSVSWIAGSWQGTEGKVAMEEVWLAPSGGAMLGLHRDVAGERMVSFEFLRIAETADGLVYLAQPGGRPPTPFRAVEVSPKRVVFENPEHDFPQRILYWLGDDGALHARVEGKEKGKDSAMEWRWTRSR